MNSGPPPANTPAVSDGVAVANAPSPSTPLRIAIIHGNRASSDLLHAHCAQVWKCEVVNLRINNDALIDLSNAPRPDIAIVGHHPPTVDALALLPELRRHFPTAKIVVTAALLNEYLVHQFSRLGPHAVVEESSGGLATIRAAIGQVQKGGRWLSPHYSELATQLHATAAAFPKVLTTREHDVLRCIAHTLADAEVARALGIAVTTAKRHRMNVARKLSLPGSPLQLIRFAINKGFASAPPPTRARS